MKFLALLMIFCILTLSAFPRIAVAEQVIAKTKCHKMMCGHGCKNNGAKSTNNCNGMSCPMMFTCSLCGFIVVKQVRIQPCFANTIEVTAPPYIIGTLTEYHPQGWQPPEV